VWGSCRTPPKVQEAIFAGMKKYTDIRLPVLVIFVVPSYLGTWLDNTKDTALRAGAEAFTARAWVSTEKRAKAFEQGVPNARVVRLSGGHRLIFVSNEMDVLREIHAFVATRYRCEIGLRNLIG
jgi:hypothetical protein